MLSLPVSKSASPVLRKTREKLRQQFLFWDRPPKKVALLIGQSVTHSCWLDEVSCATFFKESASDKRKLFSLASEDETEDMGKKPAKTLSQISKVP